MKDSQNLNPIGPDVVKNPIGIQNQFPDLRLSHFRNDASGQRKFRKTLGSPGKLIDQTEGINI